MLRFAAKVNKLELALYITFYYWFICNLIFDYQGLNDDYKVCRRWDNSWEDGYGFSNAFNEFCLIINYVYSIIYWSVREQSVPGKKESSNNEP